MVQYRVTLSPLMVAQVCAARELPTSAGLVLVVVLAGGGKMSSAGSRFGRGKGKRCSASEALLQQ